LPVVEKLNGLKTKQNEKSLIAVVTQPPRPSGRKKVLEYSAVDKWAHKNELEIIHDLDEIPSADLGVVASYGKIIPQNIIDRFRYGILNIHPSILPKYRGASPVQETFKNADTTTGLSIIKMDAKMDHGPIVSSFKEEVKPDDNAETLRDRLFEKSAKFLIELIPSYINGKINLKPQDHSKATYTKILSKQDGFIKPLQLTKDPQRSLSLIKAMTPWPGVWTLVNDKRIKILKAHTEEGKLILDEVQLEGKRPTNWERFKQSYPEYARQLS